MGNKNIVLLDTETCGLHGGVVQLGSIFIDNNLNVLDYREDLLDPQQEISIGAMAVHNITPEMVEGKPLLEEVLHHHLPEDEGYILAYNASFDVKMLGGKENLPKGVKIFCILELARQLYPKYSLKGHGYKNAEMFYGLGAYKDFNYKGELHTALYDCRVTLAVLKKMLEENNLTLDQAYKLVSGEEDIPAQQRICKMKKFRDRNITWEQVIKIDPSYCRWMVGNYDFKPEHEELKQWMMKELS